MSTVWSYKSSSTTKKPTNQSQSLEELHDTNENSSSKETPVVYTSISNSYSTEPYTKSAKLISEQIKEDKIDCCSVISQYGVDPNEFLHLIEQWTQHLIHEYKQSREHFKLLLKDKWERGELNGIKSDDDSNRRLVHVHIQKLNEWKQQGLIDLKQQFDQLESKNNIKKITNQLIEDLLQIMSSIIIIHQNVNNQIQNHRTKNNGLTNYLNETIEQLKRIQQINEKEYNTICIIGLEKAGKSSFINALLGFELLPYKIERCTQIQTILKPPSKQTENLFATIEFYNQNEFSTLMDNLPKEKDETEDQYQKRIKEIQQTRQTLVSSDTLIQNYQASDENERNKVTQKFHEYIANELYINIVKHVIIYTNKLPGENYILLDVPGCDSPILEHRLSAINAVQNADAFLFLTDGQRPSLTNDQIRLLNEIQNGHFDGMKRAFGIITKLDLCQTRAKYREHRAKTQSELEQKGFLNEHIFSVAANINLLEQTKTDLDHLKKVKEYIKQYDSLYDGFNQCKQTLNDYIQYKLPYSRYRQIINMAQQKIFRYVQDALKLGEQLIPIDIKQISLDDYIKQINTEKWNEIFDKERYRPVLAKASHWQKQTLALNRDESTKTITNYFYEQFQLSTEDIINKYHPIEQIMLEQHDISVFQMNPYDIETKQRGKIVEKLLEAVKQASNGLALFIYDKYVTELEKILNNICPEQGDLFQTKLTFEHCAIEVRTLIKRVTHPIIIATIRWPHVYNDNRIEAARELARIAPTIAFNVRENSQIQSDQTNQNLGKTMAVVLEEFTMNNTQTGILMTLFRR